ncbi:hypothetical protein C2G38_2027033 [Gigaspora rosea]|uniref:BACK domain-containing protein n=1 Tax=Gigaspora rosea TaxID=44941 RepID=A0A397W688_9GLOM|nr:hypothetical protein C2G38_2027033 [Gigaspora rosea]
MAIEFFKKLSNDLTNLLENGEDYNVIIEVGQIPNRQIFKAHSIILNYRCFYLREELINEFGLEELVNTVQTQLVKKHASWIRLNFAKVYRICFKSDDFKILQEFCNNIVAKHPSIVFDSQDFENLSEKALVSLLKLDNLQINEGKLWNQVIRWGIAQNSDLDTNPAQWSNAKFSTLKATLKNCLPHIRYFQISGEDVIDKLYPYQQMFEPTLWKDIMAKMVAPNRAIASTILPPRIISNTVLPPRNTETSSETNIFTTSSIRSNTTATLYARL